MLGYSVSRIGSTAGDSTGTTSTITITPDVSARVGDILILAWTMAQSQLAAASLSGAGFTELGRASQSTIVGSIVGWRRLQASDTDFSLTVSSTFRQSAAMCAYGHINPTSLVATARAETTSGTSHATPSGTVANSGTMLLTAISERNNTANLSWTPPTGYALRADAEYGGSNATTSTALADNLTPLPSGASYGGGSWTGGHNSETSVVTWMITALPAQAEVAGLPIASPV